MSSILSTILKEERKEKLEVRKCYQKVPMINGIHCLGRKKNKTTWLSRWASLRCWGLNPGPCTC
jgi:hypothetical protein